MAKTMHTIKLEKVSVYQKESGSNYFFRPIEPRYSLAALESNDNFCK